MSRPERRLPCASVSLDLDNLWAYLRTHGDPAWESRPGFLHVAVPRFLDFFRQRGHAITVFVVGQDALIDSNREYVQEMAGAGHEIGNHSFDHEPWLQRYSRSRLEEEVERAEEAIWLVTGERTRGFRGPGFSYSTDLLDILASRGYLYDASTFPTFLGPAAGRAYYFLKSRLNPEQKKERKQLFGKFADGFQSVKPYYWRLAGGRLLEIPVTTMPVLKLPIHASYFMYLACFSPLAARRYFDLSMAACRWTGTRPSLLLHALDFLDSQDCPELAFFPGMKYPAQKKLEMLHRCMDVMEKHWTPGPLRDHAAAASAAGIRAEREPRVVSHSDAIHAGSATP